jgi:hypothetical protein
VNRRETAKIVYVMVATTGQSRFFDKKSLDAMTTAYEALLSDLDYARCNAAVRVLLQSKNSIPAVADIRRTVLELERGPVRPAGDAWGDVLAAIREFGQRKAPGVDFHFADPQVAHCVQSLGWSRLCLSEDATADRARFIELYGAVASQERREQQVPLLTAAKAARERGELRSAGDLVVGLLAARGDAREPQP